MKRFIISKEAPAAVGPYSHAVEANGILYISGMVAIDPLTGKLIAGDITEQTQQVMKNIGAILKSAGYAYSDIVKSTCLLASIDDFKAMNEAYGNYFPGEKPARATFAVKALPLGALVEIETIAVK